MSDLMLQDASPHSSEFYQPDAHTLALYKKEPRIKYSEALAHEIALQFASGKTLHEISQLEGMPSYSALVTWGNENEVFRELLAGARQMRSFSCESMALSAADAAVEGAHPKDIVSAQRLKYEAYKWAAEVANPAVYGKKQQISGDPKQPLTFIIHTGFPDLLPHQRPPKIGPDGLILERSPLPPMKDVVSEVVAEAAEDAPEVNGE